MSESRSVTGIVTLVAGGSEGEFREARATSTATPLGSNKLAWNPDMEADDRARAMILLVHQAREVVRRVGLRQSWALDHLANRQGASVRSA